MRVETNLLAYTECNLFSHWNAELHKFRYKHYYIIALLNSPAPANGKICFYSLFITSAGFSVIARRMLPNTVTAMISSMHANTERYTQIVTGVWRT